ncbi:MAG: CspA family cold shock protein [Alphaproteobacteria bacterium]|nr:CspA family cold shock protein [Alphaproteobacteria bacterium]
MPHDFDNVTANVTAQVKWYNPNKGFGFVQPADGGGDAFLHASVLGQSGYQDLGEGDTMICDIAPGPRGPQVVAIHSVERSEQPRSAWSRGGDDRPSETVEGTVKFFDAAKGFGFVTPDGGGKDVFVSARILTRCGLGILEADQRVRVTTRLGPKGPMAEDISLI